MFSVVSPWPLADLSVPMFSGQGEKVGCFYGNKYRRLSVSTLADFSGPMFGGQGEKEYHKWREIKGLHFTTLKWQTHTFLF